eukprot:Partr_v1_DN28748_c5_g1_i10_m62002 putative WD repeat domain 66
MEPFALKPNGCMGLSKPIPCLVTSEESILYACGNSLVQVKKLDSSQRLFQGHVNSISAICKAAGEDLVVTADSGSSASCIIIWSISSQEPVHFIDNAHMGLGSLSIACHDRLIVSLGADKPQTLTIWEIPQTSSENSLAVLCSIELPRKFKSLALDYPRNSIVLTADDDVSFVHFDIAEKSLTLVESVDNVRDIYSHIPRFRQTRILPEELERFTDHELPILALTSTDKGDVLVWTNRSLHHLSQPLKDGLLAPLRTVPLHAGPIVDFAFVEGGFILTVAADGKVKAHNLLFHAVFEIELMPTGDLLSLTPLSGRGEGELWPGFPVTSLICTTNTGIYHSRRKEKVIENSLLVHAFAEKLSAVAFHPSSTVASVLTGNSIEVFDYGQNVFEKSYSVAKPASSLVYSPSGVAISIGFVNGSVEVVNDFKLETFGLSAIPCLKTSVESLLFSPNGGFIVAIGMDSTIGLIYQDDTSTWKWSSNVRLHRDSIVGTAFSPTSEHLYVLSTDRHLSVWDMDTSVDTNQLALKDHICLEDDAAPLCMLLESDGRNLIYATSSGKLKWFDTQNRQVVRTIACPQTGFDIDCMRISNAVDPFMIFANASRGYAGVNAYPIDGSPLRYQAAKISERCLAIEYSQVGNQLVAAGESGVISIWNIDMAVIHERVQNYDSPDVEPFFSLLPGGKTGKLYNLAENSFYYAQLKSQGENTLDKRVSANAVEGDMVPKLMRTLGYFASERELANMTMEIDMRPNPPVAGMLTFEELIKLFVNHRRNDSDPNEALSNALENLGNISVEKLGELMKTKGEVMDSVELERIMAILNISNDDRNLSETLQAAMKRTSQ